MLTQILLIIIGLVVAVIVTIPKSRKKAVGICKTALGQSAQKEENKEKIIALLQERGEISNADAQQTTGLHRRSIRRYMDELEEEGIVEQIGEAGRAVTYRLSENPK